MRKSKSKATAEQDRVLREQAHGLRNRARCLRVYSGIVSSGVLSNSMSGVFFNVFFSSLEESMESGVVFFEFSVGSLEVSVGFLESLLLLRLLRLLLLLLFLLFLVLVSSR